ncbi:MAG: exosortase-associated EpsI family protein [Phycisphaerales bacterium]
MRPFLTNSLAPIAALALAMGLWLHMRAYGAEDSRDDFHAAVAAAVKAIPDQFDDWVGSDQRLPEAAIKLLRPNALFARGYVNVATRRSASVVLVHCRDVRDMTGHYPPNCYPANGWTVAAPVREREWTLWGRQVPIAEYRFARTDSTQTRSAVVYDFFVLPTAGVLTGMERVYKATGDHRARPYGAAQVQVLVDDSIPEPEREEIVRDLLEHLGEVVKVLESPQRGGAS